jgi:hypothetical protein
MARTSVDCGSRVEACCWESVVIKSFTCLCRVY